MLMFSRYLIWCNLWLRILGEDAWKILISLPCKFEELRQTRIIAADIIVKNGFKIEISGGTVLYFLDNGLEFSFIYCVTTWKKNNHFFLSIDNQYANLTEVAQALNYYGVKELKETLILASTWPIVELSDCRPLRVINHIKVGTLNTILVQRSTQQALLSYCMLIIFLSEWSNADLSQIFSSP